MHPYEPPAGEAVPRVKPPAPAGVPGPGFCIASAVIVLVLVPLCYSPAWDWMLFQHFSGPGSRFAGFIQALQYDLGRHWFAVILAGLAAFWSVTAVWTARTWQHPSKPRRRSARIERTDTVSPQ